MPDLPDYLDMLCSTSFCVIDVETTGLVARHDRITEIAAIRIERLRISGVQFASLVNPECPIPPLITQLTGITDAMVKGAPPFRQVSHDLLKHMEGSVIVAHNAPFDMAFLREEFSRAQVFFSPSNILDTVSLARRVLPGLAQYKLTSLCQHLHIRPGMHRAAGDALATAELFLHLARLSPDTLAKKLQPVRRASC